MIVRADCDLFGVQTEEEALRYAMQASMGTTQDQGTSG